VERQRNPSQRPTLGGGEKPPATRLCPDLFIT